MKRILLVANAEKEGAEDLARQAADWLEGEADLLGVVTDPEADLTDQAPDLVIVFGGDGTVLNAVRRLGDLQPPLLTVNRGRLGYLAEVGPQELEETLPRVLAGHYRVSERMLLHARVTENGEECWHGHAVNEFVLWPYQPGRMLGVEVAVDGRPLTRFSGDGLIVASPTGSTAYALSAGGPVVSPELRATVLVPISPHQLTNRPLVLGGDEVLTIRHSDQACARFAFDGREAICLGPEQTVEIKASSRVFRLVLNESMGRYDILRAKLGWGVTP